MDDLIPSIINGVLPLLNCDAEKAYTYSKERISDIIEPLELASKLSQDKGTKMEQIQGLN